MTRLPSLGPRGEGWLALQLVMLVAIPWSASVDPWRLHLPLDAANALGFVGTALSVLGVAIAAVAAFQLSRRNALSPLPRPAAASQLVETGLYRFVRHPIYSGLALLGLGWVLSAASPLAALAELGLVVVLALKAQREELWLASHFPGYAAYRARTKRLIPGVL